MIEQLIKRSMAFKKDFGGSSVKARREFAVNARRGSRYLTMKILSVIGVYPTAMFGRFLPSPQLRQCHIHSYFGSQPYRLWLLHATLQIQPSPFHMSSATPSNWDTGMVRNLSRESLSYGPRRAPASCYCWSQEVVEKISQAHF